VDEIEIIDSVFKKIAEPKALENDCYRQDNQVFTKDVLIEGVHFFSDTNPKNLAKKALRVNLSDIASMGATPKNYLLGIVINRTLLTEC